MKTRWMTTASLAIIAMNLPCSQAQTKAEAAGLTGLAHVAIRVSNVDSEVAFFGKLGFKQAFANAQDGRTTEAYVKINDLQFIELMLADSAQRPAGFADAGFESADLNALNARYAAAGLKPTPVHKGGAGNLIFMVDDAEGRETVFTQYLPDSRHMKDKGQHLGVQRVSEQLLGFQMPVKDMGVARTYYESLGFDAEKNGAELLLSLPSNPDLRIELHAARGKDQPEFLFGVESAKRAADELRDAGLKVDRHDKLDLVRDPDGNTFGLMETVADSKHRGVIPWRHKTDE